MPSASGTVERSSGLHGLAGGTDEDFSGLAAEAVARLGPAPAAAA